MTTARPQFTDLTVTVGQFTHYIAQRLPDAVIRWQGGLDAMTAVVSLRHPARMQHPIECAYSFGRDSISPDRVQLIADSVCDQVAQELAALARSQPRR